MGRAPGPESGSFHSPLHHLTSTYTIRYIYSILTVICAAAPNREHQRAPARATLRYIPGAERRREPPRCSPLARRPAGPAARRAGTGRALRHGEHRGWRRFAAGRPAGDGETQPHTTTRLNIAGQTFATLCVANTLPTTHQTQHQISLPTLLFPAYLTLVCSRRVPMSMLKPAMTRIWPFENLGYSKIFLG